jgi:hypothetical protein
MFDIQKFCDALGEAGRNTRKNYHLTLGDLAKGLADAPTPLPVVYDVGGSPFDPGSYRGYYADLAFDSKDSSVSAGELLAEAQGAIGKTFTGYKGGDFTMDADTPLWRANYGHCGRAIIGMSVEADKIILHTKADRP